MGGTSVYLSVWMAVRDLAINITDVSPKCNKMRLLTDYIDYQHNVCGPHDEDDNDEEEEEEHSDDEATAA